MRHGLIHQTTTDKLAETQHRDAKAEATIVNKEYTPNSYHVGF